MFDAKDITRFKNKHARDLASGCWNWLPPLMPNGYGQFHIGYKFFLAHRLSYMLHRGDIPDGLVIDHKCRNRRCVNPDHLEPVTMHVNVVIRGFGLTAENFTKTHCKRGHAYDETNTYEWVGYTGVVHRHCRECRREEKRTRRVRERATI